MIEVKKVKMTLLLSISVLITFFILDTKAYYYGLGKGYFSKKIPYYVRPYYFDGGLIDEFVFLEENSTINVIRKDKEISITPKRDIHIGKLLGYWFDEKTIVLNILDQEGDIHLIEFFQEFTNSLYQDPYIFNKISYQPTVFYDDFKYIDLDKSRVFFRFLKLSRFFSLVLFVLFLLFLAWQGFKLLRLKLKPDRADL